LDAREDVRGQPGTGESKIYCELCRASDNLNKARDSGKGETPSQPRTIQSPRENEGQSREDQYRSDSNYV